MEIEKAGSSQQLCVACNRLQASNITSCQCGHVLREAVTLRKENTRKRRAPFRPNSISSEWIGVSEPDNRWNQNRKTKIDSSPPDVIRQNGGSPGSRRGHKKQNRKKMKTVSNNLFSTSGCNQSNNKNNEHSPNSGNPAQLAEEESNKQTKLKEFIHLIENSYQNIYFNRCKSYKKAKLSDIDFEFDFSTFDSHNPYYPSALEDINTKINRTNRFWRTVENES